MLEERSTFAVHVGEVELPAVAGVATEPQHEVVHLGGGQLGLGQHGEDGRPEQWPHGEEGRRPVRVLVGRQGSVGGGLCLLQTGFYDLVRTPCMLGERIAMVGQQLQEAGGDEAAGGEEAGGDARPGGAQGVQRGAGRLVRRPPA